MDSPSTATSAQVSFLAEIGVGSGTYNLIVDSKLPF